MELLESVAGQYNKLLPRHIYPMAETAAYATQVIPKNSEMIPLKVHCS